MGNTNLILNIYIWRPIAVVPRPCCVAFGIVKTFVCVFALSKTNAWCQSLDEISRRTVGKCRYFDNFLLFLLFFPKQFVFQVQSKFFLPFSFKKSTQAENSLKEKKDYCTQIGQPVGRMENWRIHNRSASTLSRADACSSILRHKSHITEFKQYTHASTSPELWKVGNTQLHW